MPTRVGGLVAPITGDISGLLRSTRMAKAELQRFATAANAQLRAVGDSFNSVGRGMTTRVTAPVTLAGVAVAKMGGDFEQGMNKVLALTQAGAKDFQNLSAQARELGRTTRYSATQASDAMGFMAMAGFEANQIIGAMPSTLQLAAAAQLDLGSAADITTNILTGYQMQVADLGKANDVLVKTFTSANVNLSMLGQSFKYAGPVAKAAGLQFEETAAIMGALGNAGIQGSMAGTTLRQALIKILSPSEEAAKAMKKMGVDVDAAFQSSTPMITLLQQMEKGQKNFATETESTAAMMEIFGARAGPGMQALLSQGSSALEVLYEKIKDSGGIAQRVADTQLKGFKGAMIALKSAIEGAAIAIFESGFGTFLTGLATKLTGVFRAIAVLDKEVLSNAVKWAALAAAIGPVLMVLGSFIKLAAFAASGLGMLLTAIGLLFSPIGLLIGAIVGLMAVFIKMEGFANTAAVAWQAVETAWKWWVETFKIGVDYLVAKMRQLEVLPKAAELISKAWVGMKVAFKLAQAGFATMVEKILGGLSWLLDKMALVADFFGFDIAEGLARTSAELAVMSDAAKDNADAFTESAVEISKQWDDAFTNVKGGATAALQWVKNTFDQMLIASGDKAGKIKEIIQSINDAIAGVSSIGATNQAAPAEAFAGGLEEDLMNFYTLYAPPEEVLEQQKAWAMTSSDIFTKWLEDNTLTAQSYADLWANTFVTFADGFADSIGNMIANGTSFRDAMTTLFKQMVASIISQMVKWLIVEKLFAKKKIATANMETAGVVAAKQTQTAATAAAAAPHPWLIPLFVAAAMMFFAKAIGGSSSGGGGGGGVPAASTYTADTNTSSQEAEPRPVNMTIVLEGGTRIMTPEERAEEIIQVMDDHLDATGGTLVNRKIVIVEGT